MQYEKYGSDELMELLDQVWGRRGRTSGCLRSWRFCTQVQPEKLMDFIKLNTQKMGIPKVG